MLPPTTIPIVVLSKCVLLSSKICYNLFDIAKIQRKSG